VTLTAEQADLLGVLAIGTDERPWPLYRTAAGPWLMRPDTSWRAVPIEDVARLVGAGLLEAVVSDGHPDRAAYWRITEAGRAAASIPAPVPAPSRRRRQRKAGG
jgi:hypothetical protein